MAGFVGRADQHAVAGLDAVVLDQRMRHPVAPVRQLLVGAAAAVADQRYMMSDDVGAEHLQGARLGRRLKPRTVRVRHHELIRRTEDARVLRPQIARRPIERARHVWTQDLGAAREVAESAREYRVLGLRQVENVVGDDEITGLNRPIQGPARAVGQDLPGARLLQDPEDATVRSVVDGVDRPPCAKTFRICRDRPSAVTLPSISMTCHPPIGPQGVSKVNSRSIARTPGSRRSSGKRRPHPALPEIRANGARGMLDVMLAAAPTAPILRRLCAGARSRRR